MAKAITARRRGDDYQARLYWLALLRLRIDDYVTSVTLESERVPFVDDLVITYDPAVRDRVDGRDVSCDLVQSKYHMTAGGAFSHKALLDSGFIHGKKSMLARLYEAHRRLRAELGSSDFRLFVVSNWQWHPEDELARHVSEKAIRDSLYTAGPQSAAGTVRQRFAKHLGIDEDELKAFLDRVRFQLGEDLDDLRGDLELHLKLAGLKPIDPTASSVLYDDLAWKLFEQGRHVFDRAGFEALIREEGLIAELPAGYGEISIRSCLQYARRPRDLQAAQIDFTELFDGRFPRSEVVWVREVPERLDAFVRSGALEQLPQPVHVFFDCHLSIAYYFGHLISPTYGLRVVPVQKDRKTGYDFWAEPARKPEGQFWRVSQTGDIATEAVLGISVTHQVERHVSDYLRTTELDHLPRILSEPRAGTGPLAVADGTHAWALVFELAGTLRRIVPNSCRKLHLFMAVPAALAYLLGNSLRWIVPEVQLYEHDFEGARIPQRYYPSIHIPPQT